MQQAAGFYLATKAMEQVSHGFQEAKHLYQRVRGQEWSKQDQARHRRYKDLWPNADELPEYSQGAGGAGQLSSQFWIYKLPPHHCEISRAHGDLQKALEAYCNREQQSVDQLQHQPKPEAFLLQLVANTCRRLREPDADTQTSIAGLIDKLVEAEEISSELGGNVATVTQARKAVANYEQTYKKWAPFLRPRLLMERLGPAMGQALENGMFGACCMALGGLKFATRPHPDEIEETLVNHMVFSRIVCLLQIVRGQARLEDLRGDADESVVGTLIEAIRCCYDSNLTEDLRETIRAVTNAPDVGRARAEIERSASNARQSLANLFASIETAQSQLDAVNDEEPYVYSIVGALRPAAPALSVLAGGDRTSRNKIYANGFLQDAKADILTIQETIREICAVVHNGGVRPVQPPRLGQARGAKRALESGAEDQGSPKRRPGWLSNWIFSS